MASMKVVLTEDVENLGRVGEVVSVRGGYGRNFLIPQGKAMAATKANLAEVEQRRKVFEAKASQVREEAEALAARIAELSLSISKRAGEADTLYGSVTTAEIGSALEANGVIIDKRRITLSDPIKTLGVYEVPIRLHPDVTAVVKLWVTAEE